MDYLFSCNDFLPNILNFPQIWLHPLNLSSLNCQKVTDINLHFKIYLNLSFLHQFLVWWFLVPKCSLNWQNICKPHRLVCFHNQTENLESFFPRYPEPAESLLGEDSASSLSHFCLGVSGILCKTVEKRCVTQKHIKSIFSFVLCNETGN